MPETRKIVFSFDDGPAPVESLKTILVVLQRNGIKAEFYVLGKEVERFQSAALSIVAQGHKIQNHSWDHSNLATASKDEVKSQLQRTQEIIKKYTKATPTKIRPPYGAGGWPGKIDPEFGEVAGNLSLKIRNWDIDTEDWKPPKGIGPKKIETIEKQLKMRKTKSILNVLMHVQSQTARDLPDFIKYLKKSGFRFASPTD